MCQYPSTPMDASFYLITGLCSYPTSMSAFLTRSQDRDHFQFVTFFHKSVNRSLVISRGRLRPSEFQHSTFISGSWSDLQTLWWVNPGTIFWNMDQFMSGQTSHSQIAELFSLIVKRCSLIDELFLFCPSHRIIHRRWPNRPT